MKKIKSIHFGIYSNKAFELMREFASDGVYFHGEFFKQANDNEIIFYDRSTLERYTFEEIRNIFINKLKECEKYSDKSKDIVKLIHILENSEHLTEDEKELIGRPLNPFNSEAINTLETRKYELKVEFELTMQRLKLQLKNELEKLDKQIEELRS